ncbi:MAG: dihydrofolate reductase [Saprospiraceae bacterium]|nr:dihydrofolate reductase [Saprospiraceae bacterium]MCB9324653.1 dihydrofolate reductase [Lewinellaceae bacterium]
MMVSAIVAVAENGVIGRDNDIPWRLSNDLKYFKRTTLDHHIIMGRNNFLSIGRPLPQRTNIIITRNLFYAVDGCLIAHSVEEALGIAFENGEEDAFIIGGAMIYELSMPYWDRLYLTRVHAEVEGDVFFPKLDMDEWELVSSENHHADEKNEYDYTFLVYERKGNEDAEEEE